jgi:hypothetical protein
MEEQKMKKKLLTAAVLTLCAVTLVVGSVLTTIALLTSSSGVSNVFTVGNISIDMKESKVNSDGKKVNASGEELNGSNGDAVKVDTNSYHLLPGKTYIKDPTITVTSESDKMYLFVKSANLIRSAEAGNFTDRVRNADGSATAPEHTPLSMREQMEKYGWVEYVRSGDGTEIVWVYGTRDITTGKITPEVVTKATKQRINGVESNTAPAGELRLCDDFTIHDNVDVSVYGAAHVTFTAFAIQTTGFDGADTADSHALTKAAWEAVKNSFPYQCGIVNPVNPYDTNLENDAAYTEVPNEKAKFELLTPPSAQKPENVTPTP